MNLRHKAFPHPVLRPETDDYLDSSFQAVIEPNIVIEVDEDNEVQIIEVDLQFFLSNERLAEEIKRGNATFAVDVACPSTLYRNVIHCGEKEKIHFREKGLYGRVTFLGLIICKEEIKDFHAEDLNSEFGENTFSLKPGDLLAFAEEEIIYIEFSPLSFESLVSIQSSDQIDQETYSINLEGDMISIVMGLKFYNAWKIMHEEKSISPFLAMSVYKDCVLVALNHIANSNEPDAYRWSRALIKNTKKQGFEIPTRKAELDDLNQLAQRLVSNLAVKRAIRNV